MQHKADLCIPKPMQVSEKLYPTTRDRANPTPQHKVGLIQPHNTRIGQIKSTMGELLLAYKQKQHLQPGYKAHKCLIRRISAGLLQCTTQRFTNDPQKINIATATRQNHQHQYRTTISNRSKQRVALLGGPRAAEAQNSLQLFKNSRAP